MRKPIVCVLYSKSYASINRVSTVEYFQFLYHYDINSLDFWLDSCIHIIQCRFFLNSVIFCVVTVLVIVGFNPFSYCKLDVVLKVDYLCKEQVHSLMFCTCYWLSNYICSCKFQLTWGIIVNLVSYTFCLMIELLLN